MNKQNQGIMAASMGYSNSEGALSEAAVKGVTNNPQVVEEKKEKGENKSKLKNTLLYVGGAVVVVGCVLLLIRK